MGSELQLLEHFRSSQKSPPKRLRMTNSACGCKSSAPSALGGSPVNMQEIESMTYEGGSDVFTSNRHALHNNEAKTFNMMTFRTQATPYVSATVSSGKEECHRVTNLMLRSNFQWVKHAAALAFAGFTVAGGINYVKTGKVLPSSTSVTLSQCLRAADAITPAARLSKTTNIVIL